MKNLNRLTALTLTAAMAAALTACGGTAASSGTAASADATAADLLSEIQACGTITIAMEGTWAPWTYHDESDTLVGLRCRGRHQNRRKARRGAAVC